MEKNDWEKSIDFINRLPEKAQVAYVQATVAHAFNNATLGRTGVFMKKVTIHITHMFQWFVYGTGIAGCLWLITWLLTNIKSMIGW